MRWRDRRSSSSARLGAAIAGPPSRWWLRRWLRIPTLRHIKVEDGSGRPLGRSYRVKLWPTLIFLRDGMELARLVRPGDADAIDQALACIDLGLTVYRALQRSIRRHIRIDALLMGTGSRFPVPRVARLQGRRTMTGVATRCLAASILAAVALSGTALAGGTMSSSDKIKKMDTNGDGQLSAAEHETGARAMFAAMDTNKDGNVTAAEMDANHKIDHSKMDHSKKDHSMDRMDKEGMKPSEATRPPPAADDGD